MVVWSLQTAGIKKENNSSLHSIMLLNAFNKVSTLDLVRLIVDKLKFSTRVQGSLCMMPN